MKKTFFIAATIAFVLAPLATFAQVHISLNLPGPNGPAATSSPGDIINGFYNFALLIGGLLAFGAIVYGGVRYMAGAGNPSAQSDAKEWIWSALLGLALLAGAYMILYLINPALVNLSLPSLQSINLPPPSEGTGGSPTSSPLCSDLANVAQNNNEPYPAQTSAEITTLISCLHAHMNFNAPQFTYDQSHPSCNYTRGKPQCDPSFTCSHAAFSCHYGGRSGSSGSLAVDVDLTGAQAVQLINTAYQSCGIPRGGYPKARCEAASGVMVDCISGGATHVHISAASCDSN
ncbi:MAG TPA: pilin [Candidatus Paceibacterota bacterium]|nr:pilin [Candidatus Paceibacterota bacterium]